MQSACGVNEHHVGPVGLGALQGVVGHRGRIAAHLLLYHGYAHTLAPDAQLLHGSGTEGVGSTQIDFLARLFELPSQLTYRGCLAHAVDAYHENHVGLMV